MTERQVNIYLPEELWVKVCELSHQRTMAKESNSTKKLVVAEALQEYFNKQA